MSNKETRIAQRRGVLRINQLAREGRIDSQHAPYAEHTLRIPLADYKALATLFDLDARDSATREAAWERFYNSPAADPYRVRTRKAQLGHF